VDWNCPWRVIFGDTGPHGRGVQPRDGKEKFVVKAKIGQGILVTQEGRLPFYNFLSDEERRLLTTNRKRLVPD
jgi:hypothetical protein